MTTLSAREKLTIVAALQWFLDCVNSAGEPYDMSHVTLGDDPLSDDEIKSLCKGLRESPGDDYQLILTTEESESIGQELDDVHYEYATYLGYGNPQTDYGAEWREVSTVKAGTMRTVARLTESLGLNGEKERSEELAAQYERFTFFNEWGGRDDEVQFLLISARDSDPDRASRPRLPEKRKYLTASGGL